MDQVHNFEEDIQTDLKVCTLCIDFKIPKLHFSLSNFILWRQKHTYTV